MNIYVGNLSREVTEVELKEAFEAFGAVEKASVIKDKFTGESRGFGFVEMPDTSEAQNAIEQMNGKDIGGRTINANEARPRPQGGNGGGGRSSGGFGGSRGGNGGGRSGGGFGGRGRY